MKVQEIKNQGTLDISNEGYNFIKVQGAFINEGTVQGSRISIDGDEFRNEENGRITGSNIGIDMNKEIRNNGVLEGKIGEGVPYVGSVHLYCRDDIINNGEVHGGTGGDFSRGGSTNFICKKFENNGNVAAGNAGDHAQGGDVLVICDRFVNNNGMFAGGAARWGTAGRFIVDARQKFNNRGRLGTGFVSYGGPQGEMMINSRNVEVTGGVLLGQPFGTLAKSLHPENTPFNQDIQFTADTIEVHLDTASIRADRLILTGNHIRFYDLNKKENLVVEGRLEISTPPGGVVDFSQVTTEGCIFNESRNFWITCDSVIPPPNGWRSVCNTTPIMRPASVTWYDVSVSSFSEWVDPGQVDTVTVLLQNQCTKKTTVAFHVESMLGWVEPHSGNTDLLDPFEFTEIRIPYLVPDGLTVTKTDTVIQTLAVEGTQEVDTVYSFLLFFSPEDVSGLDSPGIAHMPEQAELDIFPNPFNSQTVIRFQTTLSGKYAVHVRDIRGRTLCTLMQETELEASRTMTLNWDGTDAGGSALPSGVYLIHLTSPAGKIVQRSILIK